MFKVKKPKIVSDVQKAAGGAVKTATKPITAPAEAVDKAVGGKVSKAVKNGVTHKVIPGKKSSMPNIGLGGKMPGISGQLPSLGDIGVKMPSLDDIKGLGKDLSMNKITGRPQPYDINYGAFDPTKLDQDVKNISYLKRDPGWLENKQENFLNMLEAQMKGEGPNLAEQQMQRGMEQSLKQQMAAAAAGKGANPALIQRQAAMAQAENAQNIASQAADLRAQQQVAAQDLYGRTQQGALALADKANQAWADKYSDFALEMFRAPQTFEELKTKQAIGFANPTVAQNEMVAKGIGGLLEGGSKTPPGGAPGAAGGAAGAGGAGGAGAAPAGAAAASDINLKKNVKPAGEEVGDFLDAMGSYQWNYKDPEKYGEGEYTGTMAQDLEKSDIGKDLVMDTPEGKMVDYRKATPLALAAASYMNNRIDILEKQLEEAFKSRRK